MNKKISALEKLKKAKVELDLLSKMKDESASDDSFSYIRGQKKEQIEKKEKIIKRKVISAGEQINKLDQVVIEDISQLIKYRQNITVPAVWVPYQGIRAANLSEIPVGKISGLESYVIDVLDSMLDGPIDSFSARNITIMSEIKNFKTASDYVVYQVPEGHIFNINSMEVLTTEITNPGVAPSIRFGTNTNPSLFYGPNQTMSNEQGYRHIIESPQNSASQDTIITFGISSESSADSHFGFGIISGCLIKLI